MGAAVDACSGASRSPPEPLRAERSSAGGGGGDRDRVSFQELARPWVVFRDGLQPGPRLAARPGAGEAPRGTQLALADGPRPGPPLAVRLGPVVGKVTDTSAVVLLEVEPPGGEVTVNVARALLGGGPDEAGGPPRSVWDSEPALPALPLDSVEFAAAGSVSACQIMEPRRPYRFHLEGLEPGTAYFVFVGGVSEEDLRERAARFRTLPPRMDRLRLLAVSGHRPPTEDLGDADPWLRLHETACKAPEVHLVLHLGGTVDAAPAAAEAAREMRDYSSFRLGIRRDLERRARDAMRGAFTAAWGQHAGLRRVLAEVGSQLPAFAPVADLRPFLQRAGRLRESSAEEWRVLLRLALEVSREYQRGLWQSGRSGSACSAWIDAGGGMQAGGGLRSHEFWHEAGPAGDAFAEEWHFHRFGQIAVLVLDTKGSLLNSLGFGSSKAAEAEGAERRPLLSPRQQDALRRVLKDRATQVLILASDTPFLLGSDASRPAEPGRPPAAAAGDEPAAAPLEWRSHAAELQQLLEAVFEWKGAQYPDREVVLLSAGPGFGTSGDVCDHKLGLSVPTVLTGPVLGPAASSSRWALKGSFAQGRFSWAYRPPVEEGNFCMVDVDLTATVSGLGKPVVEVELVSVPAPAGTSWPEGAPATA